MTTNSNMHNLTTLIKRLEAATSRLEDMATSVDSSHPSTVAAISSSAVAQPNSSNKAAPAAPPDPLPPSIEDFDKILDQDVRGFVTASEKIGGLVEQQARAVARAFAAGRTYLFVTTKAKKPSPQPPELLTELHTCIGLVDELRETNRASSLFTHLSAISEGIVALGWIVETRPADFVKESLGASQYYGNKILKEYKEKDKSHVEYIQAYYRIFNALMAYIKQHYAGGLTWNNKDGTDAMDALKQIQSGVASPPASNAQPPPPPPPLPSFANDNGPPAPPPPPMSNGTSKGGDMSAVFDQLNQGSSVTASLRKVDKSEMTHKNPSLRATSTVPERSNSQTSLSSSSNSRAKSPIPSKRPKPESMRTKKPARKELDGNKWIVENYEHTGSELVEIPAQLSQSILISRCHQCVIKVTGKANAIAIDNCTGLSILVDSLVSSLDVIKSPKFQVQVDGVVPTVLLDQVDGATVYLGNRSWGTEVFTSKSTGVNIVLPPKDDAEGDEKECPLPEQIRSVVRGGVVVSEVVEHAG